MKRTFIGSRIEKPRHQKAALPQQESLTFNTAFEVFIRAKEAEGVRERTIADYWSHAKYLLDYYGDKLGYTEVYVSDITPSIIRDYINYLCDEKPRYEHAIGRKDKTAGLSVSTVNTRLRTLRTMCRFWHREGYAEFNAMENIKPVVDDVREEVPGIADDGIDRLLASYDESQFAEWRDKILVLLLLDTGLRITEAVSLEVENVDFNLFTIYVPSQVAKNRRMREVPVSPEVARLLKKLYTETSGYFGDTSRVFHNAYGDPFTAGAFRQRLNRRKKKLGFTRLSPHMFRHTFCRNYLLNGGDLFTLQKIVDHADIDTTRKYVQMENEHVRAQHNKYSPVKRLFKRR